MSQQPAPNSRIEAIQESNFNRLRRLQWADSKGGFVALCPFLFTWGIIADVTEDGYHRRWCFHSLQEANAALEDWLASDAIEPEGYVRKTHQD